MADGKKMAGLETGKTAPWVVKIAQKLGITPGAPLGTLVASM
jgi:hypothetical protein